MCSLVRLDWQYGDAAAIPLLIEAGVYFVTRARGYRVLEHPQVQRVLAHPPTARVIQVSTNEEVCQHGELREQCLGRGAKGNRARRVSAVRRLLPSSSSVEHNPHLLGVIHPQRPRNPERS